MYYPIMKAGVLIFVSGFMSAFLAALIVSKSDSWNGLALEFEEGKKVQLVDMNATGTQCTQLSTPFVPSNFSHVGNHYASNDDCTEHMEDLDI